MEPFKLYSQKTIALATFIGGPLAAGILIRKNCISLNREQQGLYALIIGIATTVLIFAGIFSIPEEIIDKIPNMIIPAIYTAVIYFVVEMIQGKDINAHKEKNGEFYSGWRAAGYGAVSLILIAGGIFGYVYLDTNQWDTALYDAELEKFSRNEETALRMYEMVDVAADTELANFIDSTGIPMWKECIIAIDGMDRIESIPAEFKTQDSLLREYCNLRIKVYELIKESVINDSIKYDDEIIRLHMSIDEIVARL